MNKAELRKKLLGLRRAMSEADRLRNDLVIQQIASGMLNPYQTVGIYINRPDEVATNLLTAALLDQHKIVAAPRCTIDTMEFRHFTDPSQLHAGYMGILEPDGQLIPAKTLEVMIIPLVGFDDRLNRLGYGRGYYDRYLQNYSGLKIGLAYEIQYVETIDATQQDIPLDLLITEKGLLKR